MQENAIMQQNAGHPAGSKEVRPPFDERLAGFWSVRAPAWLDNWFPQVAKATADGSWTAAWKPVAAYLPLAAFVLGLLCRFIFPSIYVVYSESLIFMALVIGGAILSGPVGVMLLLGYIVED